LDGTFQADTLRLKEHEGIILQELRTARQLGDLLRNTRRYALEEDIWRYDRLIEKTDTLIRYFQAMANQVDLMGFEMERLSTEISALLREVSRRD